MPMLGLVSDLLHAGHCPTHEEELVNLVQNYTGLVEDADAIVLNDGGYILVGIP
jgi:hypothetical protein